MRYRTHRAKRHSPPRRDRDYRRGFRALPRRIALSSPLPSPMRTGADLARSPPADRRGGIDGSCIDGDVQGRWSCEGLKRFTRSVVPGVLAACVMSLGSPCAAQPDPPTVPHGRGDVFAPSAWLVVNTPLRKEIALKSYGFYIGELNTPVAQFDLPIRTTKFSDRRRPATCITRLLQAGSRAAAAAGRVQLTATTSTSSVSTKPWRSRSFASSRSPAATCMSGGSVGAPADRHRTRYRGRLGIAHPAPTVRGPHSAKPFAAYETYHERGALAGTGDAAIRGLALTLPRQQAGVRPAVLHVGEPAKGAEPFDYVLFGLIVNTRIAPSAKSRP